MTPASNTATMLPRRRISETASAAALGRSPFISSISSRKSVAVVPASDRSVSSRRFSRPRDSTPYKKTPKITESRAKKARYQAVRRRRKFLIIACLRECGEQVALAAAGVDEAPRKARIELVAEAFHVDVDDVGKGVEVLV